MAKTPNIDAFAKTGVLFQHTYCQFPHCNPSRSSFLTGLRPRTTRVTNNADDLYQNMPGVITLPHWFRSNGYVTARCGKIFHLGVPAGDESMDDPEGWDFGTPFKDERPYPKARNAKPDENLENRKGGKKEGLQTSEVLCNDDDLVDGNFARTAIDWLENRDIGKPFLLAVGFHRPHLPLVAPAKYFDLYPIESIQLPSEPENDAEDIPMAARNGSVPSYTVTANPDQRRAAIRGYLATISYMDAQMGRLLDAVQKHGLEKDTIVIFTSDHGWHLGEHGLWHKRSLFEQCTRVPFIVRFPGAKANGGRCDSLVELVDLFPTLCDLTGIPAPPSLEGRSVRPLLADPSLPFREAAFSEARRGKNAEMWGRSVRTQQWRYTEWNGGRDGTELYDHNVDPNEYTNLASDPRHAETSAHLRKLLSSSTFEPRQ